jgi:HTH-type transcriptional regulator/antitoxin HigA
MDAKPGSDEKARLEVISTLVEAYEEERFPIPPAGPIEAIRFRLDQLGLTPNALTKILGSRISEVLNRRRALSKNMIVRLWKNFGIPLESLVEAGTRPRTPRRSATGRVRSKKKQRGSALRRVRRTASRPGTD